MPAIEVDNLTKRYGARTAVDQISFSVEDGEIVAVLERFQNMDRRWVFLGMALSIFLPLMFPMTLGFKVDERVQALILKVSKVLVITGDVLRRRTFSIHALDGEGMHVKLRDAVAGADEPHELPLGGLQRGIGHHVE